MTIIIRKSGPDVVVTETELRRYRQEYADAYRFYAGTPPTLEDFIRQRQQDAPTIYDKPGSAS